MLKGKNDPVRPASLYFPAFCSAFPSQYRAALLSVSSVALPMSPISSLCLQCSMRSNSQPEYQSQSSRRSSINVLGRPCKPRHRHALILSGDTLPLPIYEPKAIFCSGIVLQCRLTPPMYRLFVISIDAQPLAYENPKLSFPHSSSSSAAL